MIIKSGAYKRTSRRMVSSRQSSKSSNHYYSLFGSALSNNFSYNEFKKNAKLLKQVSNK